MKNLIWVHCNLFIIDQVCSKLSSLAAFYYAFHSGQKILGFSNDETYDYHRGRIHVWAWINYLLECSVGSQIIETQNWRKTKEKCLRMQSNALLV